MLSKERSGITSTGALTYVENGCACVEEPWDGACNPSDLFPTRCLHSHSTVGIASNFSVEEAPRALARHPPFCRRASGLPSSTCRRRRLRPKRKRRETLLLHDGIPWTTSRRHPSCCVVLVGDERKEIPAGCRPVDAG